MNYGYLAKRTAHEPSMTTKPEVILARYKSPDLDRVYFLGTEERRLSIIDQQFRAFNLAYAISRVHKSCKVGIVGGGMGGATLAAACLFAGCQIYFIESADQLIPVQAGSPRVVYPNILTWPCRNSLVESTSLPWMNWSAGPAGTVRNLLALQYRIVFEDSEFRDRCLGVDPIKGYFHAEVQEVKTLGTRPSIVYSTNESNRRIQSPVDVDVVVICTGFGEEAALARVRTSSMRYWDSDRVMADRPRSPIKILVSGAGDGALIDAVTLATRVRSPALIVQSLWEKSGGIPPKQIRDELEALESKWTERINKGQRGTESAASRVAYDLYENLSCRKDLVKQFKTLFRIVREVDLVSALDQPLSLKASPINRLLGYLAVRSGRVNYERIARGSLDKRGAVRPDKNGFLVRFGDGQLRRPYSHVIPRHGPRGLGTGSQKSLGCSRPLPEQAMDYITQHWPNGYFVIPSRIRDLYKQHIANIRLLGNMHLDTVALVKSASLRDRHKKRAT